MILWATRKRHLKAVKRQRQSSGKYFAYLVFDIDIKTFKASDLKLRRLHGQFEHKHIFIARLLMIFESAENKRIT